MLWTEKYRPSKLEHIIGQEHFVLDAKTWVEENNMPNVLLLFFVSFWASSFLPN